MEQWLLVLVLVLALTIVVVLGVVAIVAIVTLAEPTSQAPPLTTLPQACATECPAPDSDLLGPGTVFASAITIMGFAAFSSALAIRIERKPKKKDAQWYASKYSRRLGTFCCLQKSFAAAIVGVLILGWGDTDTVSAPLISKRKTTTALDREI